MFLRFMHEEQRVIHNYGRIDSIKSFWVTLFSSHLVLLGLPYRINKFDPCGFLFAEPIALAGSGACSAFPLLCELRVKVAWLLSSLDPTERITCIAFETMKHLLCLIACASTAFAAD